MIVAIIAALLLGFGLGSLLHGLTEQDWLSTRVGAGLTVASAIIGVFVSGALAVNA